jgi:hypothetical protein
MEHTIIPCDAYVATIDTYGNVTQGELSDPSVVTTIVVDFEVVTMIVPTEGDPREEGTLYRGIYHQEEDIWEIHNSGNLARFAAQGTVEYERAERTVIAFCHKLLHGPCPKWMEERLCREMKKDIMYEIDREILRDLFIAIGQLVPKRLRDRPFVFTKEVKPLKATWTVENGPMVKTTVCQSMLPKYLSAATDEC